MAVIGAIFSVLAKIIYVYTLLVLAQIIIYWLLKYEVIKITNQHAQKLVDFLDMITKPIYKKISEKVPAFNGIDFAPFIWLIMLWIVSEIAFRLAG